MIFVKETLIFGEVFGKQRLERLVAILCRGEAEAAHDPPGVGIDDEYRPPGGVEHYGVRGFLANAVDGEEFLAQRGGIKDKKSFQVAVIS